jgi:hypothetical protein
MYKRLILLLGMFLGSHVLVAGQTPAPQIVLAQEYGAQIMTMQRTVSTSLPVAHFLLSQNSGKFPAHFSLLFAGAYQREPGLEQFSPMDEVKTLTLTQSSLPLFQLWGGRLQLDAFQSTLRGQNMQLGPLGYMGYRGLSSDAPKLSRRATFGPFLRIQPELSLRPGLADKTPDPGMAAYDPICWCCSEMN